MGVMSELVGGGSMGRLRARVGCMLQAILMTPVFCRSQTTTVRQKKKAEDGSTDAVA